MSEDKPMTVGDLINKLKEFDEDLYIHGATGISVYQFTEHRGVVLTFYE